MGWDPTCAGFTTLICSISVRICSWHTPLKWANAIWELYYFNMTVTLYTSCTPCIVALRSCTWECWRKVAKNELLLLFVFELATPTLLFFGERYYHPLQLYDCCFRNQPALAAYLSALLSLFTAFGLSILSKGNNAFFFVHCTTLYQGNIIVRWKQKVALAFFLTRFLL